MSKAEAEPSIYERALYRAPGPGKYDIPSTFNPSVGPNRFSIGSKYRVKRDEVTPGPGAYTTNTSSIDTSRGFTMGKRYVWRDQVDEQGTLKNGQVPPLPPVPSTIGGKGSRAVSILGRARVAGGFRDQTPAPGTYDPTSALNASSRIRRAPAFTMGGKPRYFDRESISSSMSARTSSEHSKQSSNHPPPPVPSYIGKGFSPSYSISSRPRVWSRRAFDDVPGPGAYNTKMMQLGRMHQNLR